MVYIKDLRRLLGWRLKFTEKIQYGSHVIIFMVIYVYHLKK
jgi:hypothetical protein